MNTPKKVGDHYNCGACNCSHLLKSEAMACCAPVPEPVIGLRELHHIIAGLVYNTELECQTLEYQEGWVSALEELESVTIQPRWKE